MKFSEYIKFTKSVAIYEPERERMYVTLGYIGEFGEFFGKIAKIVRDNEEGIERISEKQFLELQKELGDILWFQARSVGNLIMDNLEKIDKEKYEKAVNILDNLFEYYVAQNYNAMDIKEDIILFILKHNPFPKMLELINDIFDNEHYIFFDPKFYKMLDNMFKIDILSLNLINSMIGAEITLNDIIEQNVEKLTSRKKRNKIGGSGDNR